MEQDKFTHGAIYQDKLLHGSLLIFLIDIFKDIEASILGRLLGLPCF